jgi:hypothetical protein
MRCCALARRVLSLCVLRALNRSAAQPSPANKQVVPEPAKWAVGDLKRFLAARGVTLNGVLEKGQLVDAVRHAFFPCDVGVPVQAARAKHWQTSDAWAGGERGAAVAFRC